jgi:DNA mismatch repair protein MutS2
LEEEILLTEDALKIISSGYDFPFHSFQSVEGFLNILSTEGSSLLAEQYFEIGNSAEIASKLLQFFRSHAEKFKNLENKVNFLSDLNEVRRNISRVISETAEIRDTASRDLIKIRQAISSEQTRARKKIQELAKKYKDYLVDDLQTFRHEKHVLAVKAGKSSLIPGVIHDYSGTGSTVYIEPNETIQISTRLQKLYSDEKKEIHKILTELANVIRPFIPEIRLLDQILLDFDIIFAKAHYGHKIHARFPKLNKANHEFLLKKAYHPILLDSHEKKDVVPLNLEMGGNEKRVLVISGPNAGGKTIALKTVGLFSLMFQSAIPVPVDEGSHFPFFHKVFTDIGDHQSILNDLSTFSSHLTNMREILKRASIDTLVLIDELGTGTDPYEGARLAEVLLEEMLERKTTVLATTHLSDLKLFANEYSGIENASMEFDEEKLKSTFRLIQGIPGSSYAFYIAERMGLPKKILQKGIAKLDEGKLSVEKMLNELNRKVFETENLRREFDVKAARVASMEKMYEQKLEKLKKFEHKTRENAIQEAEQIVSDANKKIEATVESIKKSQAEKERIKEARSNIAELKNSLKNKKNKVDSKIDTKISIGTKVRHSDFGTIGEVLEIDKKNVKILAGSMEMTVKLEKLEFVEKAKNKSQKTNVVLGNYSSGNVSHEIDVRGFLFDEAWNKVDEYLDQAIFTGWNEVRIIHGIGTGALREGINNKLRHDARLKKKYYANEGEGGIGVTIVELRK